MRKKSVYICVHNHSNHLHCFQLKDCGLEKQSAKKKIVKQDSDATPIIRKSSSSGGANKVPEEPVVVI
jgi:hypothetical protein